MDANNFWYNSNKNVLQQFDAEKISVIKLENVDGLSALKIQGNEMLNKTLHSAVEGEW